MDNSGMLYCSCSRNTHVMASYFRCGTNEEDGSTFNRITAIETIMAMGRSFFERNTSELLKPEHGLT